MKIGYARVSTINQELETQKELLHQEGCDKIYIEKVTGTSTKPREELKSMMDHVRKGDEVIVTKIDRLARSIIDLNKIVQELNSKGVSVCFIKDNMEFRSDEEQNSMQTLLFNVLGSFAQFEADLIRERTTEGRERAKKQGKHLGRKGKDPKDIQKAIKLYGERNQNKLSVSDISKMTGVPRSTIYHELKKQKNLKLIRANLGKKH
ncbi:recombinase family protein [Piscibacillus halophilus]|uniref:Transcriptional regulator, TetR family n=1 Tax=Piscibacillus halophilus TaxID=571933 RepID=A0A1H9HC07_9BACI|nr:recombinase family protein [Piscibacillus halophilus]SEQ59768.1 transcriptional regulator, TetR family [Piscibacillus halophilus]